MGLPAYAPELQVPAERLHYFHPFRIGVASLAIVGGYLSLVFWLGGHSAGTTARTAILGDAEDPRTLHRIDAVCKAQGYLSKTHPAIEAAEYAQLVEDTADVLSYGRHRRDRNAERDEA